MDIVVIVSIILTVPVLASSYYALVLFVSSLSYPKTLDQASSDPASQPGVSVLLAVYNEKFVVEKTLDALKCLNYPREKIQIVVADDSTDETRTIVDRKVVEIRGLGIDIQLSRRESRFNFKSGALNLAAGLLKGDFVLLLDADSIVTPDVLTKGLSLFSSRPELAFVSYRVGHYNREQNLVTRLFALTLDLGDTQTKMGSYSINTPFSFQGGFTMLSKRVLERVGFWSEDSITEDADLSCKIYSSGWRGVYLSNVRIFSEDPLTFEVWKRQSARVAQGWGKCLRQNWRSITNSNKLSIPRRLALLLMFLSPFSSLSWIILTLVSAIALVLGLSAAQNSVFSSLLYNVIISAPVVSYFGAAAYSLHVQRIMNLRNLLLIPFLSYSGYGLLAATSIGFVNGIRGKMGFFFRTPKSGTEIEKTKTDYFQSLGWDKTSILEAVLALIALWLSVLVVLRGVWFLGLSLAGFGALTLKSMSLSRLVRKQTNTLQGDRVCFGERTNEKRSRKIGEEGE